LATFNFENVRSPSGGAWRDFCERLAEDRNGARF
jgi:hypothetical protein